MEEGRIWNRRRIGLRDIRVIMLLLNFIAVLFITGSIAYTTEKICADYSAREFLNSLHAFPEKPMSDVVWVLALCLLLTVSFVLREMIYVNHVHFVYGSLVFDFVISVALVVIMNFNYNGILLFVFANVISYSKGNRGKYLLIVLALVCFLMTDSQMLSLRYKLYALDDYFRYYGAATQQYLVGIRNFLTSLNIILFIIFCILLIQQQKGTIEEINLLNEEIRKANDDLQNANSQLEEYARITERMGETKERNRLAREIHDTLGHTLTGISVGIDACIATVELAPAETKTHLERISEVARNGLLEIRRSVSELKPDALERLSLENAITKMITDMKSITDMQIFFDCKLKRLKFDEDEEGAIYRVIQESLTNAMRHGKASRVWIVMERREDLILLTIRDDGVGCKEIKSGFGTKHITERVAMLNGSVEFQSENGFCVIARIPIRWGEEYD